MFRLMRMVGRVSFGWTCRHWNRSELWVISKFSRPGKVPQPRNGVPVKASIERQREWGAQQDSPRPLQATHLLGHLSKLVFYKGNPEHLALQRRAEQERVEAKRAK